MLQILPPDNSALEESSALDGQLFLVIFAMAMAVFLVLKIAKKISTIKVFKSSENKKYSSQ